MSVPQPSASYLNTLNLWVALVGCTLILITSMLSYRTNNIFATADVLVAPLWSTTLIPITEPVKASIMLIAPQKFGTHGLLHSDFKIPCSTKKCWLAAWFLLKSKVVDLAHSLEPTPIECEQRSSPFLWDDTVGSSDEYLIHADNCSRPIMRDSTSMAVSTGYPLVRQAFTGVSSVLPTPPNMPTGTTFKTLACNPFWKHLLDLTCPGKCHRECNKPISGMLHIFPSQFIWAYISSYPNGPAGITTQSDKVTVSTFVASQAHLHFG